MPSAASGFCVYNDVAVAIQWLLDNGARRVAYVDVDVHHGDGVQKIFYNDPRVLTISLHETGQMLFPGTGYPIESGGPGAVGTSVNVALPPGTGAVPAVVPPLVRAFEPDILVTQHGCDSHASDPLAHLMLSVDGHRASYLALHELAHEVCRGRWVATGGGGYEVVDVVPRSWSHLLAIVGGVPLDVETETDWCAEVAERMGRQAPLSMTDGREPAYRDVSEGIDPDSWLDRAITETRAAVFPENGLNPEV
jgi:acetoin utilization protein AcuC